MKSLLKQNKRIKGVREMKKLSVKQARETAKLITVAQGGDENQIFNDLVSAGGVSAGRGCYTEGQEYFNNKYNDFKSNTLKEMKKLGLKLENSKGQIVDIALNHKAVK